MSNKKAPLKDAWHGYNSKKAVPPCEAFDLLHMANQLFPFGLLTSADMARLVSFLQSRMRGKTFIHEGQTYKIINVFLFSETCIKARCELMNS